MDPKPSAKIQNPLDDDLLALEAFAEDPRQDMDQRRRARKAATQIRELSACANYLERCAKMMKLDSWCRELSDAELAEWVADGVTGRRSTLYSIAGAYARSTLEECDASSELYVWHRTQQLYELLCVALTAELGNRQRQNENFDGRTVRHLLVEQNEDNRGAKLAEISRHRAAGLWIPSDLHAGRADAASEFAAGIWEAVHPYAEAIPTAANPATLAAFMTGGFNRLLGRVRDQVRNEVETATRRISPLCDEDRILDQADRNPALEDLPSPKDFLQDSNRKLLVEQVQSRTKLSVSEKAVLQRIYYEGHTQEEAAKSLGLSQGEVSKIHSQSIKKLSKAMNSQSVKKASLKR